MSLPRRTIRVRLLAIVFCLFAFGVYLTFAPTRSSANVPGGGGGECGCSGGGGSCSGHAECVCMYSNGACTSCSQVQNSCNCGGC